MLAVRERPQRRRQEESDTRCGSQRGQYQQDGAAAGTLTRDELQVGSTARPLLVSLVVEASPFWRDVWLLAVPQRTHLQDCPSPDFLIAAGLARAVHEI